MQESSSIGLYVIGAAMLGCIAASDTRLPLPKEAPAVTRPPAAASPPAWSAPARDPFLTAEQVRSGVVIRTTPAAKASAAPAAPVRPELKLTGTLLGDGTRVAVLNGAPHGEGDVVDGVRLVRVSREEVLIAWNGREERIPIAVRPAAPAAKGGPVRAAVARRARGRGR